MDRQQQLAGWLLVLEEAAAAIAASGRVFVRWIEITLANNQCPKDCAIRFSRRAHSIKFLRACLLAFAFDQSQPLWSGWLELASSSQE